MNGDNGFEPRALVMVGNHADKEKLKILNLAKAAEEKKIVQDQQAVQTAQSNLDEFHADPEAYLKKHKP